jgi:threonine/homoserine/homoserine lactone efflux protein
MTFNQWLIYLSIVVAIIATPGPSAALCLSHGASHGRWLALATVLGGMLASSTLMALSALGLGAVIAASDSLFLTIKLVGAAYLIYLGVSMWRAPAAGLDGKVVEKTEVSVVPPSKLFRNGFMVGIGNPKDLLFFGALFPQFLNPSEPMLPQLALLGITWLVVDGTVMFAYAVLGVKLATSLGRFSSGKLMNRLTGSVFIVAGGALAGTHK